jgi:hypothetical protein
MKVAKYKYQPLNSKNLQIEVDETIFTQKVGIDSGMLVIN